MRPGALGRRHRDPPDWLAPAQPPEPWLGDDVVFRCSAFALGCGTVAAAAAAFGCANDVLALFSPELSWMLLCPSALVTLLGAVGLRASCRFESRSFRAQLAASLLILAVVLAGAGGFVVVASGTAATWVSRGCDGHRTTGLWEDGGRLSAKLRDVEGQYATLRAGWEACRGFDPLVYDLSDCGARAIAGAGPVETSVVLFSWLRRVQLRFACGGFCEDAVPIFGALTMRDTLVSRPACAEKVAASVQSLGGLLGCVDALASVPLLAVACVLFCAARPEDDEYDPVDLYSDEDDFHPAKDDYGEL